MTAATTPNDDGEQDDDRSFDVPNQHAREYLDEQYPVVLSGSTLGKPECELRLFVEFLHTRNKKINYATLDDVEVFFKTYDQKANRQETLRNKLSAVRELYKYIRTNTDDANGVDSQAIRLGRHGSQNQQIKYDKTIIR
jgi:site-specific recombinase XerD